MWWWLSLRLEPLVPEWCSLSSFAAREVWCASCVKPALTTDTNEATLREPRHSRRKVELGTLTPTHAHAKHTLMPNTRAHMPGI